ncbi:MAG: hypothetical protein MJE77_36160 [Proteobacteria bacterium]|nr:hypothetical protein [Pseudomonadota bacterium]
MMGRDFTVESSLRQDDHRTQFRDAASVANALTRMYGAEFGQPVAKPEIIHVMAVWQRGDDYITLRINQDTPKSDRDFFVLNAARARADAIVTTGRILRDEPDLVHDLDGPGQTGSGLAAWRRDILGKPEPPHVLILTSGRGIPGASDPPRPDCSVADWHPAVRGWARPIIYTTETTAAALRGREGDRIRVVGAESPGLRSAIVYLRDQLGCRTISIEAGPSTVRDLYNDPVLVDELLLSVFHGKRVPDSVRGAPFIPSETVAAMFARTAPAFSLTEPSGPWRFHRLVRT